MRSAVSPPVKAQRACAAAARHQDVIISRATEKHMARVAQLCAQNFDGQQLQLLAQDILRGHNLLDTQSEQQKSQDYTSGRLAQLAQRKKRARVCMQARWLCSAWQAHLCHTETDIDT